MTAITSDAPAAAPPISFAFLAQVILIANSFIMLYPVVVMVLSAFKTTGEIFEHPLSRCPISRRSGTSPRCSAKPRCRPIS